MENWSNRLGGIYNSLEGEIVKIMIEQLEEGTGTIQEWQWQKMRDLGLINEETLNLIADVSGVMRKDVEDLFMEVGERLVEDIDESLPYQKKPIPNNLDQVMKGFSDQTWRNLENFVNQTLVTTNYGRGAVEQMYTDILNKTTAYVVSGMHTFEEGVQMAVREAVDKGLRTVLTDKGGNHWKIDRYARTVIKSTLTNAYDKVRKERMEEYGEHLVVVSSHAGAREACSKIQGQVVDLRPMHEIPDDSKYRSIYDPYWEADYEAPGGHRGVNCRHIHFPFVDGVNTNNQPQFSDKENTEARDARNTQRRIEREIVKYKKDLMVSKHFKDAENIKRYEKLLNGRERKMKDHLKHNGKYLSRNLEREETYVPISEILKDV